jgi:hypothetical protein
LLSAPQALFGLALDGLVLIAILVFLTVTAWVTAAQRIVFVYRAARREHAAASLAREGAVVTAPLAAPVAPATGKGD